MLLVVTVNSQPLVLFTKQTRTSYQLWVFLGETILGYLSFPLTVSFNQIFFKWYKRSLEESTVAWGLKWLCLRATSTCHDLWVGGWIRKGVPEMDTVLVRVLLLWRDTATLRKKTSLIRAVLQFQGLVHYHYGGKHDSIQASMMLERYLRILHQGLVGSRKREWIVA